jgi:hypothetical protein
MLIEVRPDGSMKMLYDDSLKSLMDEGKTEVARASDVEPDGKGGWTADLTRVGGPVLGPFPLREDALTAEKEWLWNNSFGDKENGRSKQL